MSLHVDSRSARLTTYDLILKSTDSPYCLSHLPSTMQSISDQPHLRVSSLSVSFHRRYDPLQPLFTSSNVSTFICSSVSAIRQPSHFAMTNDTHPRHSVRHFRRVVALAASPAGEGPQRRVGRGRFRWHHSADNATARRRPVFPLPTSDLGPPASCSPSRQLVCSPTRRRLLTSVVGLSECWPVLG